jgi:hypothetical protein
MRISGTSGDIRLDSDAQTGVGRRSGSNLDPRRMTARERAALRRSIAEETAATRQQINQTLSAAENTLNDIRATVGSGDAFDAAAEAAAQEAENAIRLAGEQAENALIGQRLAQSEADRAAAEAAVKAAQAAAEKAAADAKAALDAQKAEADRAAAAAKAAADAAIAAAEKAAQDAAAAAIKAAQDAANAATAAAKEAAERALAEANARAAAAAKAAQEAAANAAAQQAASENIATAAAARSNINVAGNVPTTVPGPFGTVIGAPTAADVAVKMYAEQQAAAEKQLNMQRESVIATLTDRFNKYNLQGLIPTITRLAREGATESTITLALQETDDYKRRFAANQDRMKKGLQVLSPADYLNLEDSYRQTLRAYGLNQFDTDAYVSKFIANDMSPAELSQRVATAVQRVQNADPAITKTLRDFYGIGQNDLVAYVLDPNQQFQKIERQVAAAEIGSAGRLQGIEVGAPVAEQLAAQGITQAQAQKGYATIADILPTAEKLSSIYGDTLDTYGLKEAEQEVFNTLASAQRKRQRLTQREFAEFSGQAGVGRASLDRETRGQF